MQEDSYVIQDVPLETALQGISTYTGTDLASGQSASSPLAPSQLKTSTGFDLFKIVDRGTVSVTKGASSTFGQTVVPHTLGYIPTLVAFYVATVPSSATVQVPGTLYPLPYITPNLTNGLVDSVYGCAAQQSELDFFIQVPVTGLSYGSVVTQTFQYFLLHDSADG